MLPKKNKADTRTLKQVFSRGKFLNSPLFTLKFIVHEASDKRRVSVIVPKNVGKLATERNRLRRMGYKALERRLPELPNGISGAFIFRKTPVSPEEVERGLEPILKLLKK